MTKKLFFILTFLIFSGSNSFAADCSDIKVNPIIKVMASYGKLSYDHTKNFDEITLLAKKFNLVEKGVFASGLSTVNINFDITINTVGRPIGNFEYCVVPTEVTLFLGMDNPIIYIADNLKEETCEYNLVLRHEKTHQQINKTVLEYYLPLFKQEVTKIIKNTRPIKIKDIHQIEKTTGNITVVYNKKIMPLINFIKKEMLNEQKKLDSSENYRFENSICSK